jgi:glutaminase
MKVPNFDGLIKIITEVYNEVKPDRSGANASYIPQLAEVNPEQFGISVTTTDG